MKRKHITETLFGALTYSGSGTYCTCPGEAKHTHPNGERDCIIYGLEGGVPTIHCAHKSCKAEIAEANQILRATIGKAERPSLKPLEARPVAGTWVPPSRAKAYEMIEIAGEQSAMDAASVIPEIVANFGWDFSDSAPITSDHTEQYERFLDLWQPDDWLWIGENRWSGPWCRCAWGTAKQWRMRGPSEQGVQTSFCCYKPGSYDRTITNVLKRPYLVFESDTHDKLVQAAIINWIRSPLGLGLSLRMVCDTGGKSLHAWFDAADLTPADMAMLKPILTGHKVVCQTPIQTNKQKSHPGLGGDPAMFIPSQPVRLPGPMRPETNNRQRIVWLSPDHTNP